jgi:hypothetical protein
VIVVAGLGASLGASYVICGAASGSTGYAEPIFSPFRMGGFKYKVRGLVNRRLKRPRIEPFDLPV